MKVTFIIEMIATEEMGKHVAREATLETTNDELIAIYPP
jgi:hypothetical protein